MAGIRYEDALARETPEFQARVAEESARLLAEYKTLRQLREARNHSREEIAQRLGVQQSAVSKIARRTDPYLSTPRKYVEAVGGKLRVTAEFPGGPTVVIDQFGEE
jgi:predicted transcriptional regulator